MSSPSPKSSPKDSSDLPKRMPLTTVVSSTLALIRFIFFALPDHGLQESVKVGGKDVEGLQWGMDHPDTIRSLFDTLNHVPSDTIPESFEGNE